MTNLLDSNDPSAIGDLCAEHRVIERVLAVLGGRCAGAQPNDPLDVDLLARCVEFFRFFADACHHAKEEDLLFPILEQRGIPNEGGPIGVMLAEHREGRRLVCEMARQLDLYRNDDPAAAAAFRDAAAAYVGLLTMHIGKEDERLFVMGDRVMTNADKKKLVRSFCEVGCRNFNGRDRKALVELAEQIEADAARGPGGSA